MAPDVANGSYGSHELVFTTSLATALTIWRRFSTGSAATLTLPPSSTSGPQVIKSKISASPFNGLAILSPGHQIRPSTYGKHMPSPELSNAEAPPSEPALTANPDNLPAIIPNRSLTLTTDETLTEQLVRILATSYVRRENRFYHIDRPSEALSQHDLQRSFLLPAQVLNNGQPVPKQVMKEVYDTAIVQMNPDPKRSIPVWTGGVVPYPGNRERRIQLESGQVVLNSWKEPSYRRYGLPEPHVGPFSALFHMMFQREAERNRVMDWLAWCLQNESKKPNWAIMLYSQDKGTGKSTLCNIATRLFGEENTARQNNLEKVAGKFNAPMLTSKLIVSEEVELRPGSDAGNKLKTLITEATTTTEHKGRDVERVRLHSCFLLTSNHLPTWIEAGERRFYVVDVGHDGHASGPNSAFFTGIVRAVEKALCDDERVAAFYSWLMQRELAADFNAMTLNTKLHGTDLMRRLEANQVTATTQQLAEYLGGQEAVAITEQDLRVYLTKEMRLNANSLQYMMTELKWHRYQAKYGGKDYARAIWVRAPYALDRGQIIGPDGSKQAVCDVLWASEQ